jgi:hypothetical protein
VCGIETCLTKVEIGTDFAGGAATDGTASVLAARSRATRRLRMSLNSPDNFKLGERELNGSSLRRNRCPRNRADFRPTDR